MSLSGTCPERVRHPRSATRRTTGAVVYRDDRRRDPDARSGDHPHRRSASGGTGLSIWETAPPHHLPGREVSGTSIAATRSIPKERVITPVVEVPNYPLTKY